jgi:hypothetical protein
MPAGRHLDDLPPADERTDGGDVEYEGEKET